MKISRRLLAAVAEAQLAFAMTAAAQEILVGAARARAADAVIVRSAKVRLVGISAPSPKEICDKAPCDGTATSVLEGLVGGREIHCEIESRVGHGSFLGTCRLGDGTDLAAVMLRAGLVRAGPSAPADYRAAEQEAKDARRGLWADE